MNPASDQTRYLTSAEVARRLRYHPASVARRILAGDLPAVRIGGRFLVAEGDLADFIKRSRVVPRQRAAKPARALPPEHFAAEAACAAAGL